MFFFISSKLMVLIMHFLTLSGFYVAAFAGNFIQGANRYLVSGVINKMKGSRKEKRG